MTIDTDVERLIEVCLRGDRRETRDHVDRMLETRRPDDLLMQAILPALERIQRLDREDHASKAALNLMLRSIRLAVSRITERLDPTPLDTDLQPRRISLHCGTSMVEELQAEIFTAILEHDGHVVRFLGGGVPADEILEEIGRHAPDVLLLFASSALALFLSWWR